MMSCHDMMSTAMIEVERFGCVREQQVANFNLVGLNPTVYTAMNFLSNFFV